MIIIKPALFAGHPLLFGFSTKIGCGRKEPFFCNMSLAVDDTPAFVLQNREAFITRVGLPAGESARDRHCQFESVAFQKQIHTDDIHFVTSGGLTGESDAQITDVPGLGLAVSTADCVPLFLYDTRKKIIAGIHAGWRSSALSIVQKTIQRLVDDYACNPADFVVYIGPSISQKRYQVGEEVTSRFPERFSEKRDGAFYIDLPAFNEAELLQAGVSAKNIQRSSLCTYEENYLLHSYRKEGSRSGRAIGIIAMKDSHE